MKESISVWLRVKLEQLRGPSLSGFKVSFVLRIAHNVTGRHMSDITHVSPSLASASKMK